MNHSWIYNKCAHAYMCTQRRNISCNKNMCFYVATTHKHNEKQIITCNKNMCFYVATTHKHNEKQINFATGSIS